MYFLCIDYIENKILIISRSCHQKRAWFVPLKKTKQKHRAHRGNVKIALDYKGYKGTRTKEVK